ncbi:MAG TPA: glycine oxidase ThiO [Candidatus Dormibacteraeota bacterium]|nr:glycine oxidase ThiO [Candidatus Dormibacteraeota bacterium]
MSQLFYNAEVKTWDAIIVGGGIIGLSLAIALRKRGAMVLVVERGEPGREASHAAGGMLVDCPLETPAVLQTLATASARMYPEFAHELEVESGMKVDLRDQGTIFFLSPQHARQAPEFAASHPLPVPLREIEPALRPAPGTALYLRERSADPRALSAAAWKAAKNLGVDFSSGDPVTSVDVTNGQLAGVTTAKTSFSALKVVNCAGAWSGQIGPYKFPTRPVKGQILCLAMPSRDLLSHVVRTPEVYLIPRSDGRLLVGATVEEAGFDKRTDPETIQRLHRAALQLVPKLKDARILEAWAGLRPGTPDALPILGGTPTPGYYVATGHFRDGILLAPITAQVMAQVISNETLSHDLTAFSPQRFT